MKRQVALPIQLQLALARYYRNCNLERRANLKSAVFRLGMGSWGTGDDYKWDKPADLDHISAVAAKLHIGMQSSAGTFWFTRKTRMGNFRQWQVCEADYLEGGKTQIKSAKQPSPA